MASVKEAAATQGTPRQAALDQGLDTISYNQEVTFHRYVRLILPADGFVFWARGDIVNPEVQPLAQQGEQTFVVKGSLHYATDQAQLETESYSTNRVVFTSQSEVNELDAIDPEVMWIGEFGGLRFAFSARGSFYEQSGIYHYVGHAVYSALATQIIDDPAKINLSDRVVSNSLPIWLSMNNYQQPFYEDFGNDGFTLYPSDLVPMNLQPPFASVHILPETTQAFAMTPTLDRTNNHEQLCHERVRITFYGVRNDDALTFMDFVNQFSLNFDTLGLMNSPVIRDEKRPQVEFNAIAERKAADFEVSYYQTVARDQARKLILSAFVTYYPQPY